MSEFNPGDGWREVQYGADLEGHESLVWESTGRAGGTTTMWVREDPVPPLPTEPYTVIRVTWKSGLRPDAREYVRWSTTWESEDNLLAPEELADRITGFEVLAEPCHEHYGAEDLKRVERDTAQKFLDRVRRTGLMQLMLAANPRNGDAFDAIAREFGVQS